MILILFLCLFGTAFALTIDTKRDPAGRIPTSFPTRPTSLCRPGTSCNFSNTTKTCNYQSYTALGDSYSAGLNYLDGLLPACDGSGVPCNGGDVCLRNNDAFPMLMQQAHNFSSFQFIACSGANTTDCDINQVQSADFGRPDLVTITIGSNNNQAFLGLIVNCVYQREDTYCQSAIQNAQNTIATIDSELSTHFTSILSTNPTVRRRVIVVGYPRLWSTTNSTTCQHPVLANVPPADRQTMNDLADGVNAALKKAASSYGPLVTYADADSLFEGNRLCDDTETPYFQYDFATALFGVFHPTDAGQQVLFKVVEAAAGCS